VTAPAGRSFGTRLGAVIALAVGVALVTAAVTALIVGPRLFHDHLAMGGTTDPDLASHVDWAFRDAGLITLGVAAAAGLAAAVAVALLLGRPIAAALHGAAATAQAVAGGDYAARVEAPNLGAEFATLADSFNAMAADLAAIEATRRQTLSDLAHELRTPIAALTAYHDALADGVRAPDAATLDVLRRHTARLARLAEDIALVSQAEEGRLTLRPEPVSAAAMVEAAVLAAGAVGGELEPRRVTVTGPEGQTITAVTSAADGLVVKADPDRLGQVLANLIANALRATAPAGHVTVVARPGSGPDGASGVAFEVADDGVGLAAGDLPHVFERFYRVGSARDRGHGGTGIGLAVVRAITAAHGGFATAASPGEGQGATFTVWLPAG
jgi:signal transduction histidine kinase